MLNSEDCRELAEQYRERSNKEDLTPRLANVLLSISNAYRGLASQLDLLAEVERQERARLLAGRGNSKP